MSADAIAAQIREARALVHWSRERLAAMADVSRGSVARIEQGDLNVPLITVAAMRAALEAAGVEFFSENGCPHGVRLKAGK